MSVIVAVTKNESTVVACDSVHFKGARREDPNNLMRAPKVTRFGQYLIGCVGPSAYDTMLELYLRKYKGQVSLKDEVSILRFFVDFWGFLRKELHLLEYCEDPDERSQFAELGAEFMVASRHGMFTVDSDLTVMRLGKYCAIGSGDRYAWGAAYCCYGAKLSAAQIARKAASAAVHFDRDCGGEILVLEVP